LGEKVTEAYLEQLKANLDLKMRTPFQTVSSGDVIYSLVLNLLGGFVCGNLSKSALNTILWDDYDGYKVVFHQHYVNSNELVRIGSSPFDFSFSVDLKRLLVPDAYLSRLSNNNVVILCGYIPPSYPKQAQWDSSIENYIADKKGIGLVGNMVSAYVKSVNTNGTIEIGLSYPINVSGFSENEARGFLNNTIVWLLIIFPGS
jgi:hypothetical protein